MKIAIAKTSEEIARCFPVMAQLRPLVPEDQFVERVKRQMENERYRLAYVEDEGQIRCVAGFRTAETLVWGPFLYVDDLVTRDADRSKGYGKGMLDWLIERARSLGCHQFHLDSGVQRHDAHRFYEANGMTKSSFHYSIEIDCP